MNDLMTARDNLWSAVDFHAGEPDVTSVVERDDKRPEMVIEDPTTGRRFRVIIEDHFEEEELS